MNWRIEHTNTLALLHELPDEWAQTCIAYPPAESTRDTAVFSELLRVLRSDGTLWLLTRRGEPAVGLAEQGWISQPVPWWAAPLALSAEVSVAAALFTKQTRFFHRFHTIAPRSGRATPLRDRRLQRCERDTEALRPLVRRCILASTSPVACGACGAPYDRAEPDELGRRRASCVHHDPRGRCLVLDPFYTPAQGTLDAAHAHDRTFLGIADKQDGR